MFYYFQLIRIHTLPLVFASLIMGVFLSLRAGFFSWDLSILILLTATNLQIVANIANDYGDGIRKIDGRDRIGFERMMQSKKISKRTIKLILLIHIFLAVLCGLLLLFFSFENIKSRHFWTWLFIGFTCMLSALGYSLGKKPYSYSILGDISVFIYFGPVAVIGSYLLLTQNYSYSLLLESCAIGFLAVSVLNLNNIRDLSTDKEGGRQTVAVRLGEQKAKIYQKTLVLTSFVIYLIAAYYRFSYWYQGLLLLAFLPIIHLNFTLSKVDKRYNQLLKKHCVFILLFSLIYGVALNL